MDIDGHKHGVSSRRRPTIEKVGADLMQSSLNHGRRDKAQNPLVKQNTHFHYEQVEFERIEASLEDDNEGDMYNIRVSVKSKVWVVHRTYDNFISLDSQVHLCTFSRLSSALPDLQLFSPDSVEDMNRTIAAYLERFTGLCTGHPLYCGSILGFFEIDNQGNRLMSTDDCSAINIPAVAAAQAIKPYMSQAADELTLQVGDMVSVIDNPPPHESSWWRGKKKFEVGFFPSECVDLIGGDNNKILGHEDPKPVLSGRGKLIAFLRMFFSNRPNRSALKQEGIVKERVFGCDLAEHLSNVSLTVPHVLTCCCEAIEEFGMLNGIYRLCGVASNIQQLRAEFDRGVAVDLRDENYVNDIHTITAVLKMYFRELPNPLLTYHLYDSFSEAVELSGVNRINKIKSCITKLPPPHYRTAKHLFGHIHRMSNRSADTGMDSKNLAIVWSPNLMRSKEVEAGNVTGAQMLYSVSVQATLVESLISNYDSIFTEEQQVTAVDLNIKTRPNSVAMSANNRLLTLSEAQSRVASDEDKSKREVTSYISDGADVLPVFHTIIDFNTIDRRTDMQGGSHQTKHSRHSDPASRSTQYMRETVPRWKSLFHKNKSSSVKSHSKKHGFAEVKKHAAKGNDITENEIAHLSRRVQGSLSTSNIHLALFDDDHSHSTDDLPDEVGPLQRAASHDSFFDLTAPPSPLPQTAVRTLPSSSSLTHPQPSPSLPTNPAPLSTNAPSLPTNPVPLSTNPVPLSTNPVPLSTNPAPLSTNPAPLSTKAPSLLGNPPPLPTNPPPPKPARTHQLAQLPPQAATLSDPPTTVAHPATAPDGEGPVAKWLPAKKSSLTPGVVFRPGYSKPVDVLVAAPKATWKQSMTHVAEEYHPLSNVSTMHRSIQHIPQFLPALSSRSLGDKGQPSPSSTTAHIHREYHQEYERGYEDENLYEEVIPRSSPELNIKSEVIGTNLSPRSIHISASVPATTEPPRNLPVSKQSAGLIYAPVSYSPLALSASPDRNIVSNDSQPRPSFSLSYSGPATQPAQTWPPATSASSPAKHSSQSSPSTSAVIAADSSVSAANSLNSSADQFSFSKLEQHWQSPEMVQCMNQAVQARLSRSYSNSDSESRPSRAASRRNYGTELDTPVYANVQLVNEQALSEKTPGAARPALVPIKCRQTDVDSAIAISSAPFIVGQHGRRPSRKMEYVNRKSYDDDQRKVVRSMSPDKASKESAVNCTAEQHYMNVSDKMLQAAAPALSSSWSSAHAFSANSSYSQPSYRNRFDSVGSDSHSSTEDRLPNRSVRQRRITPPSPAPRKLSLESNRRAANIDSSLVVTHNADLESHSLVSTDGPLNSCQQELPVENGRALDRT